MNEAENCKQFLFENASRGEGGIAQQLGCEIAGVIGLEDLAVGR